MIGAGTQKMRSLAQKMKKITSISILAAILQNAKIRKFYKGNLGGQVLKRLAFSLQCTNFAVFFKLRYYNVRKVKNICSILAIALRCIILMGTA